MQHFPDSFYTDALDKLGYTKELSEKRVKICDNFADCYTRVACRNWRESIYAIVAGSRGEGTAVSLDSDLDIILVQPAVKCFETYPTAESREFENYAATFQLDLDNAPEGYTKLQIKSYKTYLPVPGSYFNIISRIEQSLVDNLYLKSGLRLVEAVEYGGQHVKREGWVSENYNFTETSGPSQPLTFPLPFPNKYLSFDFVQAIPCSYPSLFHEWSKRERKYDWPSRDVQTAVKESDVFVVSVGHSGSKEKSLQWRISSTPAERLLVRSFSDSQIKLYVAMKMLVKHELKPICSNITSYIVKNVIFWVFEEQSGIFQIDEFVDILLKALKYLKECVTLGCLRHYVVCARNLLEGKILEVERQNLIDRLDALIKEGSSSLLRCPLINKMLNSSPEDLKRGLLFRQLSDEVLLSILSLEPTLCDILDRMFHKASGPDELLMIYSNRVLPVIRDLNPFEYFGLLRTMGDVEILSVLLTGADMGFDETWRS